MYFVKIICWNNLLTLFMNMSKRVVMRINNKRTVSISLHIRILTCYTGLAHHIAYMNKIQNVRFYAQDVSIRRIWLCLVLNGRKITQ